MYELRDRGCIEEARKVMRDLLAIEVVPFYRDLIQINLDHLAVWKPDIRTQPPEWNDIRELAARLKAGQPLRLTPKVITILKRAAPTLGFGDDETAKGLRTVESATTLLRRMHRRIQRGANQLFETTFQMYIRRDTGDLEGARQVMSDALAVEVVPQRRRLMAHYLEQLDRWKPPRSKRTAARKTPHGKASPPRKPRKDSKGTRRSRSG
jgi:DUSAM domain-containing protein